MKNKIPVARPDIGKKEALAVYNTVKKGWITMGEKTHKFENLISKYLGAKYVIAMNNGTSTLDALLTAFDISPSDEIIIPNLTYISTANVVSYKKAKIILADCDSKTFNVSYENLIKKISNKTKLIIITDMKGMPVDYDSIKKISKKYKIPIIADSAESFGSEYKGKKIGNQLIAHSFSFFANKNLTTAEGGAISTNNKKLGEALRRIRNQGQMGRYNHVVLGNNYRLNDVLSSIGIEQIKKIDVILKDKNKIAKRYNAKLKDYVVIPYIPNYVTKHSFYNYCIKVPKKIRNKLIKYLQSKNIETRISFPPISIQPIYKKLKLNKNSIVNSNEVFKSMIDLPIYFKMTNKEVDYVCNSIIKFLNKNK